MESCTGEEFSQATNVAFRVFQNEVNEVLQNPPPARQKSANRRKFRNVEPSRKMAFESLAPFLKDGVWCTRGRFGSDLGKIIGPSELPILPPGCRLARLVMETAHAQSHRGGAETCFRSRNYAWILRARPLADEVSRNCPKCPILWKAREQQMMAKLPEERFLTYEKPFTAIALDFFGPYLVRAVPMSETSSKSGLLYLVACQLAPSTAK